MEMFTWNDSPILCNRMWFMVYLNIWVACDIVWQTPTNTPTTTKIYPNKTQLLSIELNDSFFRCSLPLFISLNWFRQMWLFFSADDFIHIQIIVSFFIEESIRVLKSNERKKRLRKKPIPTKITQKIPNTTNKAFFSLSKSVAYYGS